MDILPTWMEPTLARAVCGKRVWDIGCGPDAWLAPLLASMGVVEASFVDPLLPTRTRGTASQHFAQEHVHAWTPAHAADVALLFRPVNYPVRGLVARISEVPCIAYLGDNVYSACGGFDLWAHLLTRPLWVHATQPEGPHRSLLIYGPSTGEVRAPACAEEKAAVRNELDRVRVARELVQRFTGIPVSDR